MSTSLAWLSTAPATLTIVLVKLPIIALLGLCTAASFCKAVITLILNAVLFVTFGVGTGYLRPPNATTSSPARRAFKLVADT